MLTTAVCLCVQVRAAERRLERATQAVARAKAALPDAHADKRQRAEPPAWAGREYASYDTVEYWRQEEGRIYKARREELSADVQCRLPRSQSLSPRFARRRRSARSSAAPRAVSARCCAAAACSPAAPHAARSTPPAPPQHPPCSTHRPGRRRGGLVGWTATRLPAAWAHGRRPLPQCRRPQAFSRTLLCIISS